MGKAAKRERQKINRDLKASQIAREESRKKTIRTVKTLALILIVPAIIAISILINKATEPDTYTAKITVAIEGQENLPNKGLIEVEFDYANAPKSVKHFMAYASNGDYDGLTWHRVVKDFVIQGGDPVGNGSGNLGDPIQSELPVRDLRPGDLAWAKAGNEAPGTAGSQFFIVTGSKSSSGIKALNQKVPGVDGEETYQYGFIGHITKGLDVARAIENLAPEDTTAAAEPEKPTSVTKIIKIEVFKNGKLVKRGDYISPTTTTSTSTTLPVVAEGSVETTP